MRIVQSGIKDKGKVKAEPITEIHFHNYPARRIPICKKSTGTDCTKFLYESAEEPHCKNVGVVVTPNWGVSKLCTSDTSWGVMIF